MDFIRRLTLTALSLSICTLLGCTGIGSHTVARDLRSKTIFTFLMFIFSLTETGGKEGAPIITVPAG